MQKSCAWLAALAAVGSIVPASAIASVFTDAREATGGEAWTRVRSITAEGKVETSGMNGTWREAIDLRSPRRARSEDFGIVRYDHTWNGPMHWRQVNHGGVHALDSDFGKQTAVTDEWLAQRRYLQADGAGAAFSPESRRSDGGGDFIVVTATPQQGQPVELWFDATTHLLARSVRRMNIDTETIRYSDYRSVARVKLPFLMVDGDDPGSAGTYHVAAYRLDQATSRDFAAPVPKPDFSIAGGRTTVPIRLEGYVVVEAKIDGKGPFDFILDTGGHDILTTEAAKALGLKPEGAGSSGGSGEGKVTEQYARVGRLEIGGMTMRDQVFFILPMPHSSVEQGARASLSGIIGMELFERFAVRLDYPGRSLTLTPAKSYRHTGPGVAVPLFFNDDEPLIKAALNGRSGDFGIDTGNTGSLIVQGRWAEREGLATELAKGYDTMGFGMGGASHNWASRADFEMAGVKLPRIVTRYSNDKGGAFASIVEAGNIGNSILANFVVDFDYSRGHVWFRQVGGYTAEPFSRAGASISKESPDAFKVMSVPANSPAGEAGLAVGDEIVAVDGVPAAQLSGEDMVHKVREAPGTRITFDVRREGKQDTKTMVLRELLP